MDARLAYRALLHLYPLDYRVRFEAEMVRTFGQAATEQRTGFDGFLLRELFGLAAGAAAEWAAKLTTNPSVRARSLSSPLPGDTTALQARIASLIDRTVHAIAHHDFEGARRYCREENELRRLGS